MSEEDLIIIKDYINDFTIEGKYPYLVDVLKKIEPLQQELEQQKEKNIELAEELQIAKGGIKIANLDMVDNNYVSKDKIKDKIKEFENKECESMQTLLIKHLVIEMLENLLKEN